MTPQELKASILQLAIQGKLVPQLIEEGTGEELYQQIQAEKQRLIKAGTIKKEKPLPAITEDEIPFDIPESWQWVHVAQIVTLNPKNDLEDELETAFVPMPYVMDGFRNQHTFEIKKWKEIKKGFTHFAEGDIGVAKITPCFQNRKSVIFKDLVNGYGAGTTELTITRTINGTVLPEYLLWFFKTEYFIVNGVKSFTGTAGQQRIHKDYLATCLIPLPPLAEQKRIVAKIEELLPLIDRYEQAWSKLEDFNKRFPVDMQKSILQMAIQGKLVPQLPEEGTGEELFQQIQAEKQRLIKTGTIKKEKPLPEITEDEIPFDIPESWKWAQFGTLYSLSNGTASRGSKDGSERPVLRLADLSNNVVDTSNIRKIKLTDKEFASHMVQEDDLIFIRVNGSKDRVATAFRYTAKDIISYCDHLFCGHKCSALVDADYIMFVFNCPSTRKQLLPEIKTTAGQNTISQGSMAKILLPLPPLAEQKRIVAKLEEILPLCERLK